MTANTDEKLGNRARRLVGLAESVAELDLNDPQLMERLEVLKRRAVLALAKNVKLPRGNASGMDYARSKASAAHRKVGEQTDELVLPLIRKMLADGLRTYTDITAALNAQKKVCAPRGGKWIRQTVTKIMDRNNLKP